MTTANEKLLFKILAGVLSVCVMAATAFVARISFIADETGNSIRDLEVKMERVFTILETTSPANVKDEVRLLAAQVGQLPKKNEVHEMILLDAPWLREKQEWSAWRAEIERRLKALEK